MTTRISRTLEELVELQDKAITALESALKATQLALEALQNARTEQGTPTKIDWTSHPTPIPVTPYIPYIAPFTGGSWGTNQTVTGGGIQTTQINSSADVDTLVDWGEQWANVKAAFEASGKAMYALQSTGNISVSEGGNI